MEHFISGKSRNTCSSSTKVTFISVIFLFGVQVQRGLGADSELQSADCFGKENLAGVLEMSSNLKLNGGTKQIYQTTK